MNKNNLLNNKKHMAKFKIHFLEFLFLFILLAQPVFASLTITSPSEATFATKTISLNTQTTTTTISGLTINDDRSVSPGWTVVMTSTHLTFINDPQLLFGNNNTVDSVGSYDGTFGEASPMNAYIIAISTAGQVGTAKFDVSGAETDNDVTTGAFVPIGTKGLRATFNPANYVLSDKWRIIVDAFHYTSLYVSPGSITANSGSLDGVSAGSSGDFSGSAATSNGKVLMSASSGNGTGNYSQDIDLALDLHGNSLVGDFTGVINFTVS